MPKSNLFRRCALLAAFAGSILVLGPAEAKNDFDSLLEDINFGSAGGDIDQVAPRSASYRIAQTPELASPQADALVDPPAAAVPVAMDTEALPAPSTIAPNSAQEAVVADCGGQCNDGCSGQCGNGCGDCGHRFIKEGFCQPYTPPQLPNSTFYQYWRSNACNTHVWDGFRNRCHAQIDLSVHHKSNCGCNDGCGSNGCGNACNQGCDLGSGDCGPVPAEWCRKQDCDSGGCDSM